MKENYTTLNVDSIEFDKDNPRIKGALEKYGDQITAERIHFALRSASDNGGRSAASFGSLQESIRASRGVMVPITVIQKDDGDGYICIDGNTRLAIYKQHIREKTRGDWSKIKVVILEGADQCDIERIRVSAHLIGSRQWPAYEKARYLHDLRNQQLMDYNEIIQLCGGNKAEIQRQIDAFHDMNEYYRDVVDDTAFKIDRFSGFVELQKRNIKEAIFDAGLDLKDFGEWIRDGNIRRLEDTRELPKVLRDDEARDVFLQGGPNSIKDAIKLLERRPGGTVPDKMKLADMDIYQLALALARRIGDMPFDELTTLRNKQSDESVEHVRVLENLHERLRVLLENVGE